MDYTTNVNNLLTNRFNNMNQINKMNNANEIEKFTF